MGDRINLGNTTKQEKMAIDFARYHMELLDDPLDWNELVHARLRNFSDTHLDISPVRLQKLFKYTLKRHISDYLSRK